MTVELTETLVGGPIGAGSIKSGTGLRWGVYSFTKAAQNNYVIFGDFTKVEFIAVTVAGEADNADIDGTTTNKVTLAGSSTGACIAFVVGY